MKLPGSTDRRITKYKNDKNVPQLETTEVILVHCNIYNRYQRNSRVLCAFVPNKLFVQLISPKNHIYSEKSPVKVFIHRSMV